MTRREWLASAAVAAAAPRKVGVGAHPWVWAAKQPGSDPTPVVEEIFRELGGAGVDGIELMNAVLAPDGAVERVKELSKRHKLPVIGTSWSAAMWRREEQSKILDQARTLIPRLQQVGGRTLGISVGDARRDKTPAEFDAQDEVRNGEHDLNGTLERIPEIKLGPDLGWLYRAKVDPVDFVRRHKARMVFAHLRNEKADGTWPETLAEGVINYAAIGKLLHEAGFAGDLVIELAHEQKFTPTQSYGASFRASRDYVRRVMRY
jgi:sugar phosphate isomerase/epimerase